MASETMTNSDIQGAVFDPGRRFPIITSPEGLDALPFLSDAEKKLVQENFQYMIISMRGEDSKQPRDHAAVQSRNPDFIGMCIPDVFLKELSMYEDMISGICGIDITEMMSTTDQDKGFEGLDPQVIRHFCTAMLMAAKVADDMDVEWARRLFATAPNFGFLTKQHWVLINQPTSAVWSEEQRLSLEFTEGVMHQSLSDDLFARACELWGTQRTVLFARWITYYVGLLLLTVVNITDADKAGALAPA